MPVLSACEFAKDLIDRAMGSGGGGRTRTYEGVSQRIYSPPPLPLGTLPRNQARGNSTRRGYMVGWECLVNQYPLRPSVGLREGQAAVVLTTEGRATVSGNRA